MFRHTLRSGVCQWVELWTRDLLSFSFLWPAVWPSTAGTCRTGDSRRRPGQDTNRDSESSKTLYQSNTPKSAGFEIPSSSLNQTKKTKPLLFSLSVSLAVSSFGVCACEGVYCLVSRSLSLSLHLFFSPHSSAVVHFGHGPLLELPVYLHTSTTTVTRSLWQSYTHMYHALILCPVRHGRVDSRLCFDIYVGAP